MDTAKIKEVILSQLNGASGLYSLQIQNHIYGCFLIMEDIAQQILSVSDFKLVYPDREFHLDEQFSDIGLQYGFIMDEKLRLEGFDSDYKNIWLDCFKTADLTHDISVVDEVEEVIIEMLTHILPNNEAFFIHALETGSLTGEWVNRVLALIKEPDVRTDPVPSPSPSPTNEELKEQIEEDLKAHSAQIQAASHEKIIKSQHRGVKGAHKTRRNMGGIKKRAHTPTKRKVLFMTRRHKTK